MVRTEDHPRSRGVYRPSHPITVPSSGSSPLARGLHRARPRIGPAPGIIPARAGFTACPRGSRRRPRDHPRSRGVYSRRPPTARALGGSSPLARGLLGERLPENEHHRIIPARAGFTGGRRTRDGAAGDHPRSRGVYPVHDRSLVMAFGSSPLARGLQQRHRGPVARPGIIPARAGFTRRQSPGHHARRDHPRSRGVYSRARGHA